MRVLWLSPVPSLYNEQLAGGWVASLETIFRKYLPEVELAICFESSDDKFKVKRDEVTYYPMRAIRTAKDRKAAKYSYNKYWEMLHPYILKAISDFKPDVIHCFGSEWPYGQIAKEIKVPIIIHMQGFINIYNMSSKMACTRYDQAKFHHFNPKKLISWKLQDKVDAQRAALELDTMRCNHYFMGRTEWDKRIVKYYSPNSKYFYCPEAIRPTIYDATGRWLYQKHEVMKIVSISAATVLKGNDIILQAAKVMKDLGFKFEWRVAGRKDAFAFSESKLGLHHEDLNIDLIGYIDAAQIVNELTTADCYVHAAIIDNSPNSLCEAQLIGCPVVTTYVGGIPEMVYGGDAGILFPYNEPHTLAFKLMDLFADPKRMKELSDKEYTLSHKRHDPNQLALKTMEIYKSVIEDSKSIL